MILGWDSATFDVVDPLLVEGRLPHLARLIERGHRAGLRSSWPPMTDCAWTTAFTGRNPGAHGIFGSWYRAPGRYECRYFSSRDRRAPALWELTTDVKHLVWNVPMTFPATPVDGAMVAGYGAPPGSRITLPSELQDEIARRWRLEDLMDRAPHGSLESFRSDLIRGLEAQGEAIPWAARQVDAECISVVWPHVDRAQHFFWQFRDSDHPLAGAVDEVHEAMDRATGAIVEAFPEADFLIVSDHGAGDLKGDINIGAWLVERGYAVAGSARRSVLSEAAWSLPPALRKLGRRLAPGMARKAMGAKLAGQLGAFDWPRTKAFLGFHSDLWLNLEGREPDGCVSPEEAPALLDEIADGLLQITDPRTGEPVVAAVHRGSDLYSGVAAELAPDLILDTWSAGYRVAPAREPSGEVVIPPAPLAGVDVAWSSDHRPMGIFVGAGPRLAAGGSDAFDLRDVCPTALALLAQTIPDDLDGQPAIGALDDGFLVANPIERTGGSAERSASGEYSDEEAAAVAAHLKDLGYIE